jgi:hypothetical protein
MRALFSMLNYWMVVIYAKCADGMSISGLLILDLTFETRLGTVVDK